MTDLYPPALSPRTLQRQVWNTATARRIPGVGRSLDLIGGLISQMSLDAVAGIRPLTRPRLLEEPDLDKVRSVFVRLHVDDYLLHGNAAHLVTSRLATGWPASVRWFPASAWHVYRDEQTGRRRYFLNGREVSANDVVHVQRGADELNDCRGVGIVEQHMLTLDKIGLQEEREREDTTNGYVPSVAVIAPPTDAGKVGSDETDDELDEQAKRWEQKFSGPGRRPAILPNGTTVTPLAWSPQASEASELRKLSLVDVANMFNLDGYWNGAPAGSSLTYRTPGPLFLMLLRTTLNGILAPFEDTWSRSWLVRGTRVQFARQEILGDDLGTTVATLVAATGGPVMTPDEGRAVLQLAPIEGGNELRTPAPGAVPAPDPTPPDDDPTDPTNDPEADA